MGREQPASSLSIHSVPLEPCKLQLPVTGGVVSDCSVVCFFPFPSKGFLPGFLPYLWYLVPGASGFESVTSGAVRLKIDLYLFGAEARPGVCRSH